MTRFTAAIAMFAAGAWLVPADAHGQTLSGPALVKALKSGGYVLVMRHAASPRDVPDERTANADNVKRERQLDATGRSTATAMGDALRALAVPLGDVYTSPTYRAMETVRLARLAAAKPVPELGDGGQSMQVAAAAQAEWLKKLVTQFPKGTNTIAVTHMPNIAGAFPQATAVADGEVLVFGPDGKGGSLIVGRIAIDEWPRLAEAAR